MPVYVVTAIAEGDARVLVEAPDADTAEEVALRDHLCGINHRRRFGYMVRDHGGRG